MSALLAWTDEFEPQHSHGAGFAEAGPHVVEVALRSLAPLRERRFTAWRGRSGQRYIASVFSVTDDAALGFADAVLIAIAGDRTVLAARDSGPFGVEAAMSRWKAAVMAAGAQEIHVHLLAATAEARRAVVADLTPVLMA
jgi:hypothetical protein